MATTSQEINSSLERIVAERTAALQLTIRALESEIVDLKQAEARLRWMEQDLAQRVANQSRNLAALYKLLLFAGQPLTVDQIQDQALATIMQVMNADAGSIHQWDESSQTLRLHVPRGLSPAMQSQIETIPSDWILSNKITRTVPDLPTNPEIPPSVRLTPFQAYLGAPVHLMGYPIGAVSIFWSRPRSFSVEDIALFSAMADQLAIIVENARLRERGEAAAVLKERQRLARDLHDSVTQSLHSLVLSSDVARHRLRQGKLDRLESSLTQLGESARQALKEMRLLLYELRLLPLDQANLVEAIKLRLDAVERRAGIEAQMEVQDVTQLPELWEQELYCIAMEALNNSLKYARATRVLLRLSQDSAGVDLQVIDDGQGINPETRRPGGLGLQTMAERAERIGGTFTITSAPGHGTCVGVHVQGSG